MEAREEETVTEEKANMTVEYYEDDEDEEFCNEILDEIDTEVNSEVEIEINNEGHLEDVDSDDDSIPPLERRDDSYEEWDSDESTVQSVDERVQCGDIPRDVTTMMVAEQKKRENVTTYV